MPSAYLGLCTVINKLPNQLLTLFQVATYNELGVRGQVECLSPIRRNLDKAVIRRLLSRLLIVQRPGKSLR